MRYGGIKPPSRLMPDTSTRLMIGSPAHVAGLELAGQMLRRAGGHGWRSCVRSYRGARSESPERLHMKRAGRIHRRPLGVPHDLMRGWRGRITSVVVTASIIWTASTGPWWN